MMQQVCLELEVKVEFICRTRKEKQKHKYTYESKYAQQHVFNHKYKVGVDI